MSTLSNLKIGVITVSLLCAAMLWVTSASAAPGNNAPPQDNSDLNKDQVVDINDLAIFSDKYLDTDWESVDWCAFYQATMDDADLYGRAASYYAKHYGMLLAFINNYFNCAGDLSDLNQDSRLNARDLMEFGEQYAGEHFLRVDWCAFLKGVLDGDSQ